MWNVLDLLYLSLPGQMLLFLLVLARFSGLLLVAPFFGSEAVPVKAKTGVAVLLTLCVLPVLPLPEDQVVRWMGGRIVGVVLLTANEFALGLIFGMGVSLFFAAVQFAGQVVGQQVGFALANMLDPISNTRVSVLGQLNYLLAVGIFLAANLHVELVRVMRMSFELVPIGSTLQWQNVGQLLVMGLGSTMWQFGLRVALPTMLGLFLVTVGLGFLSRAVPEINIFIVGFGLKAIVGLWLLYLGVPVMVDLFREGIHTMLRDSYGLLTWVWSG